MLIFCFSISPGPQTGTSNKAEVHVNNNAEMDIDDAIEDIIR